MRYRNLIREVPVDFVETIRRFYLIERGQDPDVQEPMPSKGSLWPKGGDGRNAILAGTLDTIRGFEQDPYPDPPAGYRPVATKIRTMKHYWREGREIGLAIMKVAPAETAALHTALWSLDEARRLHRAKVPVPMARTIAEVDAAIVRLMEKIGRKA